MKAPLVSIIIPIYNGQQFIRATLQSCLEQTYQNWEIIVVDDGSTDNSADIVKSYSSEKICYYFKENGGQASARNYGISKAKGEWLAFLDADDLWEKVKLAKQIEQISLDNSIDLIFTSGYTFENDISIKQDYISWKTGKLQGMSFAKDIFVQSRIINSSVLVKASVLNEFRLDENPQIKGTEDWDLWLRLALDGKVFYGINERLVYYREHEQGVHLDLVKMFLGKEQLYLKYTDHPIIPKLLIKKQFRYIYRELMNHLYNQKKMVEVKEVFKRYRKADKWGWASLKQSVMIKVFPLALFIWCSNKIIYRIAYRLEKVRYFFFLK